MSYYERMGGRVRPTYWRSVLRLIGHLVGTAIIFASFLLLVWLLAYLVHWLNATHNFPTEIYAIVTKIEVALIFVDVVLCAAVLIAGTIRFIREIIEATV